MKQGLLSRCGEQNDGPTRLAAAFRLQEQDFGPQLLGIC